MAIKTVSIGSAIDIHRFDDGDTEYGVETDGKVKVGTAPTNNDEVLRLQDIPSVADLVTSDANIADDTITRGDGGGKKIQDSLVTLSDGGTINIPAGESFTVNGVARGDVSASANITDEALVRGDGGAKGVQSSLVTLNNAGTIAIPAGQAVTVGGVARGDVDGPATSTDNAIARYHLATGKIIQNSGLILDDSDNLTKVGDLKLDCGANKTLELVQVVYDDWYFEIAPKTTGAGKPTLANFSGNINQWQMAINDISELRPVEMAHKWKEATEIEIHVHWGTNGLDGTNRGVKWEIDYTWANPLYVGGTTAFAAATTTSVETQIPANTPDKTNIYTSVVSFTPAGGKIGAILLMSLKRIASVTDPTPTLDPWVFMVGVHYQIDTAGSRFISTK